MLFSGYFQFPFLHVRHLDVTTPSEQVKSWTNGKHEHSSRIDHLPCDGAVLRLVLLWQSAQLWAPPGLMDTSTELIKMQVTAPFQARMRVLGTPRRRCLLSDFLRVSFQGPAQKTGMPGRRGSSAVGLNPKPWSNQPQQLCPYLLPL